MVVGGPYQKLRPGTQVEDPVLAKGTPESCLFSVLLAYTILWELLVVNFRVFLNLSASKVIDKSHNAHNW